MNKPEEIVFRPYRYPTEWLGWYEDRQGKVIGFVTVDGDTFGWDGKELTPVIRVASNESS